MTSHAALTGRSGRALAPGRTDPVKRLDPEARKRRRSKDAERSDLFGISTIWVYIRVQHCECPQLILLYLHGPGIGPIQAHQPRAIYP